MLLGALAARTYCMETLGHWTIEPAPPTTTYKGVVEGEPAATIGGIKIWVTEEPALVPAE